MISPQKIQELAIKNQTSDINIAREYLQHLFLSNFYKRSASDKFLFKGGTALRIVFGSPRYSEDLDFSIPVLDKDIIESQLVDTFADLENEGIAQELHIDDAEPTSGGYIADISLNILGFRTGIKSNLQVKRHNEDLVNEAHLIENALFLPTYSLVTLSSEIIVKEKVQALITRFKPRDFFDLYFILRKDELKDFVPRDQQTLEGVGAALDSVSDKSLEADLKDFLPINYQPIIKSLRSNLKTALSIS